MLNLTDQIQIRSKMTHRDTGRQVNTSYYCVVPENIHTTPTEVICRMTPPPPSIFQNRAPEFTPLPLRNFQNFCTPPWKYCYL